MRIKNQILWLVMIFFISCSLVYAQSFEMVEIGTGADLHWSPDGKYIVYTDVRQEYGRLFIMNADGSDKRQLTFEE